jgi:hypothetical protein
MIEWQYNKRVNNVVPSYAMDVYELKIITEREGGFFNNGYLEEDWFHFVYNMENENV